MSKGGETKGRVRGGCVGGKDKNCKELNMRNGERKKKEKRKCVKGEEDRQGKEGRKGKEGREEGED